ncbi:toll/interleukin-1 receptor domain-containing protein [Streptosporangiaceae bacterium NEAU-GS5]|nr:toll/interleukin-1 receptor domain-containing protein [Streptosporangiaceae bacterium NEAU-GS5]
MTSTDSGYPYFFLSYSRFPSDPPQWGVRGLGDPNQQVEKLHRTLRRHVIHMTSAGVDDAGFMDRALRIGEDWQATLSHRLSTCRVFVPLYSPRYFESVECGKEWAAFLSRADGQIGMKPIVPVLWLPAHQLKLPPAAEAIQFNHAEINPRYAEEGLYTIMATRQHIYEEITLRLAKRIIEVAEAAPMPAKDIPNYRDMPSAFHIS